jgi:hypothetical protein
MHVLGLLFIVLILGNLAALGDSVGVWLFDRRNDKD